jgi:hypothetical protein
MSGALADEDASELEWSEFRHCLYLVCSALKVDKLMGIPVENLKAKAVSGGEGGGEEGEDLDTNNAPKISRWTDSDGVLVLGAGAFASINGGTIKGCVNGVLARDGGAVVIEGCEVRQCGRGKTDACGIGATYSSKVETSNPRHPKP